MTVTTTTRQSGDVTILDVAGRVSMGPDAAAFGHKIRELAAGGQRRIVLNLTDLTYIDSSGIGELVGALASVTKSGGAMRLLKPQQRVQDILGLTHVTSLFQIFDDEAAAVQSLAGR